MAVVVDQRHELDHSASTDVRLRHSRRASPGTASAITVATSSRPNATTENQRTTPLGRVGHDVAHNV
jgi:hypothetical protein